MGESCQTGREGARRKPANKCAHHTARWNLLAIAENQSRIVSVEAPGLRYVCARLWPPSRCELKLADVECVSFILHFGLCMPVIPYCMYLHRKSCFGLALQSLYIHTDNWGFPKSAERRRERWIDILFVRQVNTGSSSFLWCAELMIRHKKEAFIKA